LVTADQAWDSRQASKFNQVCVQQLC